MQHPYMARGAHHTTIMRGIMDIHTGGIDTIHTTSILVTTRHIPTIRLDIIATMDGISAIRSIRHIPIFMRDHTMHIAPIRAM